MRRRFKAMRSMLAGVAIVAAWTVGAPGALPPGRPYVFTMKGDSTVTFEPQTGLAPLPIDYKAGVEYLVNVRNLNAEAKSTPAKKRPRRRRPARPANQQEKSDPEAEGRPKTAGLVEFALHSAEISLRHRGQMVVETRIRRSRFQGRLLPEAPILTVSYNESPPRLRSLLDRFDTAAAALAIDDQGRVINRQTRFEGPLHPIVETLMSIHTPIPRDAVSWDIPAQLAMGHGQTARGTLHFEKMAATGADAPVKVMVSGTLQAEGAIVGNIIKDGTYQVAGEQVLDPRSGGWTFARWIVDIKAELATQGATVAHVKGKMIVESRALAPASAPSGTKNGRGTKPSAAIPDR